MSEQMQTRKDQHLDIVLERDVEHRDSSLLECVELVHQSLPELDLSEIRSGVRVFHRQLQTPMLVTGMTGGSERARRINHQLAEVAQRTGVALGVGSMRPVFADDRRRADYDLRGTAPDVVLLGNLGVMQAKELSTAEVADLLNGLGYDALCLHLNPAQELAQLEGDRGFRGATETIGRYVEELPLPVIVKETGAGLSPQALDAIRATGAAWVDVSGKGGTSWTKVEGMRPAADPFGQMFGNWGIPTAASLHWAVRRGFDTIASGGVRTPLHVLQALSLGARLVGMARPVLITLENEGVEGAVTYLTRWAEAVRRGMLLIGAAEPAALRRVPRVVREPLTRWWELDRA